ncbi:hypothetical protein CLV91_1983 [Maribacter vaceletii]|uniref:HMA domain-containing protein n=1 Tax=Maribacter vaceletii TaxID=1206816 RepID=A0A495E8Y2_9FLAO|nr:hypothetical protein [Maribacter vaceletii]RKR13266.1 hypothetical protein CLV91_1983 [Maribacter vaceletii]
MILVFKTTVKNLNNIKQLKGNLDKICEGRNWSFDLEDVDKVLRVESTKDFSKELVHLLNDNGFKCEDLDPSVHLH